MVEKLIKLLAVHYSDASVCTELIPLYLLLLYLASTMNVLVCGW